MTTTPAIILVTPQLPENIGSAARAMLNFGLTDLRLVRPRVPAWPNERARATASGADSLLQGARTFETVGEAVAGLTRVYATTWRNRELVKWIATPRQAAAEMRERAAAGERAGVLFGPERTGLLSDDLAFADAIVTVPINPAFPSLNLAQAVLLVAYEWFQAGDATPPRRLQRGASPPADRAEFANFLRRLTLYLDESGFFHPPEKRDHMIRNLEAFFVRGEPTEQELRTLHGVIKTLRYRRDR